MYQDTEYMSRIEMASKMNPTMGEVIAVNPNAMMLKNFIAFNLRGAVLEALNGDSLTDEERRILTISSTEFMDDMIYVDSLATRIAFYTYRSLGNKLDGCSAAEAQEYIKGVFSSETLAKDVARLHGFAYQDALQAKRNSQPDTDCGFGGRR